ncbi:PhnD/SsuA/transferrin family substrate-binding protein [Chloroflexota bacterium]
MQDGRIKPRGIDLDYLPVPSSEVSKRMLQSAEFDAAEMSISSYLTERSGDKPRFIAIPVFPSKMFRHSYVYVNKNSGIKQPKDLMGKKVGIPKYTTAGTLWIRGILQHDYGVSPSEMEWYIGGKEGPGQKGKKAVNVPNISFHQVPEDKSLQDMLINGEIDVLITPRDPERAVKQNPNIRRLWPKFREIEIDYFKRTGIFPIMHILVIKQEVYDAYPWVAPSLFQAFSEAKKLCGHISFSSGVSNMHPWSIAEYETVVSLMGENFWSYGVEANRVNLETVAMYSYEQGLSKRSLTIEELFAPNTLELTE